ncbi:MAG TPA: kelch repeat-containing protein [Thermoplasmata archaeon]|nr:kelch repeat-containing protein [Thermoplasmata archaeon]
MPALPLLGRRLLPWMAVGLVLLFVLPSGSVGSPASHAALALAPTTLAPTATSTEQNWVSISPASGPSPLGRSGAALAFDPLLGYSVLYGGCSRHLCPLQDTWKFQTGNWSNLTATLGVAPPARAGAVFVFDVADGYLLLFGGAAGSATLGDTWRFSSGTWSPVTVQGTPPPARAYAQGTYDPVRGSVVVFGGRSTAGTALSDTWTYSAGVWTNLTGRLSSSPPARFAGALGYDAKDGYSVLFGGTSANRATLGDTWVLGSSSWTNLTGSLSAAPPARSNTTLAYDGGRATLLLFGGYDGVALSDTWTYVTGAWAPLTENLSSSPGPRFGCSATYDANAAYLLLFGGYIGASRYTTWLLLSPIGATLALTASTVAPGTPVTFTAGVAGGLAPYIASWQFGDGSAPVTGLVAGHTYTTRGTFVVLFTVSDAAGGALSLNTTVTVRPDPLNVSVQPSASSGKVGTSLTFTTTVTGGVGPFTYAWSSPAGVCTGTKGPVLACDPASEGTLQVSVTVTDTSGQLASTGLTIAIAAAPGGGSATSPTPTPASPALGNAPGAWVFLLPLAVALAGALVVGIVMYVAGRRRARAQLAERPLCYAVPAWSETPPDFSPGAGTGQAVESWSRSDPPGPTG